MFDPKPLNPKPILLILDQYIYRNPLFSETEPDMRSIIADLDLGVRVIPFFFDANIQNCAIEVYSERREQFLEISDLDLHHVHNFADAFIDDIQRLHKRFKDPILGYERSPVVFDEIEKWIFFSSELTYSSLFSSKMFKLCYLRSCARPLKTELSYRPKICLRSTGKSKSYGIFIVRLCKSKSDIVHC